MHLNERYSWIIWINPETEMVKKRKGNDHGRNSHGNESSADFILDMKCARHVIIAYNKVTPDWDRGREIQDSTLIMSYKCVEPNGPLRVHWVTFVHRALRRIANLTRHYDLAYVMMCATTVFHRTHVSLKLMESCLPLARRGCSLLLLFARSGL